MHNTTDVISGLLIGAGCITVGYVAVRAGLADAHRRNVAADPEVRHADTPSLRFTEEVSR
jgi:hypothetical protein